MLNMSKEIVLNNLESIAEICRIDCKAQTSAFNVFSVLKIQTNEVLMCRFLGAILDPCGLHKLGTFPLKSFIEIVLHRSEETEESLSNAIICLEDRVNTSSDERQYGRADIVIRTKTNVYPIEVKISASDQPRQLLDYYEFYFGKTNPGIIYYLTPDGRKPSDFSKGTLSDEQLKLLSFSNDINSWLDCIMMNCNEVNDTIRQYKEAILSMTDNNETMQSIKDSIIFEDPQKLEMIKVLNVICQKDNATEIRKEILRKYWASRIEISSDEFEKDQTWGRICQASRILSDVVPEECSFSGMPVRIKMRAIWLTEVSALSRN